MIAAILIVKIDEQEINHLQNCLESIKGRVDGIFLNFNHKPSQKPPKQLIERIEQLARAYNYEYIITGWHNNFAEARNANLAQVPKEYDWIIWLDTDDKVKHPEKIREVAKESKNFDCVFVDYDYDHDEHGNVTTTHLVGRLFKNNGSHHWNPKTSVHETLVETRSVSQGMTHDFVVIHQAQEERTQASFQRNIKMLEDQLKREAKDPDPRTFFYLASTYMDAGDLESAKELFKDYLEMSGWDQERSLALTKLGRIYEAQDNRADAKIAFARAIAEDPSTPDPRIELASLEVGMEQWTKARSWLEYVLKMDKNQTTLERNPLSYTFRAYILLAEVYLNLGGEFLPKATKFAKKALKYKKNDPAVKEYAETTERLVADRELLIKTVNKYKKLRKKNKQKALAVLEALPEHLKDNPVVSQLMQVDKPFKWPKKSIAIMTGDTALDEWGPWSLKDGIGGSEEAIIRLAPKLAKLGYKVVVYAKPGARTGLYDGVVWRNYWDCNLKDEFDIFIAWRAPFIFEKKIKARKSYLWMHDVMEPGEFTSNRIANFTKCILLSKYHRSLFPMIPDEKVLLSANGIDPEEFQTIISSSDAEMTVDNPSQLKRVDLPIKRDPHKIFYGSSHVRGLAYLYQIWPEVKKAVPDATLDVYYGRESYDKVHKGNPERMKWMDDMIQKAKELEGVTDHGKVSQDKIVREGFSSGLWAYPCPFPEIYCITAIKSQASGAIPVATNFAALDETIQFGTKIKIPNDGNVGRADKKFLNEYKEKLIWWLQHPKEQEKIRPAMQKWAKTKSWTAVSEQWDSEFSND